MTTITLEHVSKQFVGPNHNSIIALDNVSLQIPSGDVLAVLGPSGCGKSTMLRIIAGLEKADSGQVLYNQTELADLPLEQRGIGMVFQSGALIPHWETRRSVGFFLHLRKREHEVPERIKRISQITGIGIEQLLDRRPAQLSGGEKQRVSIARALTRDLNLLLFDEPFANIDAKFRVQSRIELKRLLNEFPVTSIYVTHDQTEAIALSKRIAVMRQGKFEQIGTFQHLYDSPVNLFVAQFIGTPPINLFEGKVENGRWYGEDFGGFAIRNDLPDGTLVTLGIRPQHLFMQADGVPGVIDHVMPFYAERYKLVEMWLGKERWQVQAPLEAEFDIGSTAYCGMDENYALYFDTRSGKRIG